MYEKFTDAASHVMRLANEQACRFNHEYIGTEHLLLGLVEEGSCDPVFAHFEVDPRLIRLEVEKRVHSGPDMTTMGKLPPTPRAKRVVEYAITESARLGCSYVETKHLLLGLLSDPEGVSTQVLMNLGLKLDEVQEHVRQLIAARLAGYGELELSSQQPSDEPSGIYPTIVGHQPTAPELFRVSALLPRLGLFGPLTRAAAEAVVVALASRADVHTAVVAPWSADVPGLCDPLDLLKALARNIDVAHLDNLRKFLDSEISRRADGKKTS